MKQQVFTTKSFDETVELGAQIGEHLEGGEVLELTSDLGGGKTTFTRGLAAGFGSSDPVASPSFTINYVYGRPDGKKLWHFDFYRLTEAGIVADELAEAERDSNNVIVVEWGEIVHDILPNERANITINAVSENEREIICSYPEKLEYLFKDLKS